MDPKDFLARLAAERARAEAAEAKAAGLVAALHRFASHDVRCPKAKRQVWQCSGCREVFFGKYRAKCPACERTGYWTGSVTPEALAKARSALVCDCGLESALTNAEPILAAHVEAAVAPVRAERDALVKTLVDVQDALNDADGEPCTCGQDAWGPCAYCGPMMRAERKISAALAGSTDALDVIRKEAQLETHVKETLRLYNAACPGWATDGKVDSMITNIERYREKTRDEAWRAGWEAGRRASLQATQDVRDELRESNLSPGAVCQAVKDAIDALVPPTRQEVKKR